MKFLFLIAALGFWTSSFSQSDSAKISVVLKMQQDAWNEGDVETYMLGYWNNDKLKFIGKSGITYGWKNTLENYKRSYPDKAAMGNLSFNLISFEKIGRKHYLVIGQWHLEREKDELKGFFSLVWKKIKGNWVIVTDHSS